MKKSMVKQFSLITVVILLLTTFASAGDTYWQGASGNWSTAANWDNGEPTSSDNAYINNGGLARITSGNDEDCDILYLGENSGDGGTVNVTGGSVSASSDLYVGREGSGTLNITGGAVNSMDGGYVGGASGSTGRVTVDGSSSSWTNTGSSLYIGHAGSGTITITNGADASNSKTSNISNWGTSTGTVTVDGSGSTWMITLYLHVGVRDGSFGTLNITNGGAVSNMLFGSIGNNTGATGEVTVDGDNSTWTIGAALYAGLSGKGTLNITNGGLVSVVGTLYIDFDNVGNDGFIFMADSGMLALNDSGWAPGDDLTDFLALISGSGAINYWDGSVWADIAGATEGDDYTLEHITDGGDLDGYTVLTVNASGPPPDPDPDIDMDGDVDLVDFGILAGHWQETGCDDSAGDEGDWCYRADIDHSTEVDQLDLAIMASEWLNGTPLPMAWVTINDPGVPGHEGFNGEMSKYETTNAQYCEYLNSAISEGLITVYDDLVYATSDASHSQVFFDTFDADGSSQITYDGSTFSVRSRYGYRMNNHPVVEVSWYGAAAFCDYYGYRLPTEWEWQAVADYDGSYTYGCGTTISSSMANYNENNPLNLGEYPYTTPVNYYETDGRPGPFGYGVCDMAGNVWEWTSTVDGSNRVYRGGSFRHSESNCTVSITFSGSPGETSSGIGFRACR